MPDASLDHVPTAAHRHITRLTWALVISLVILITELVAGIASNSLALLADAGHVFADVSGMAFALVAVRRAARPLPVERGVRCSPPRRPAAARERDPLPLTPA